MVSPESDCWGLPCPLTDLRLEGWTDGNPVCREAVERQPTRIKKQLFKVMLVFSQQQFRRTLSL